MLRALQHGVMSALWIQALLVNTVLIALAQRTTVPVSYTHLTLPTKA